MRRGSNNRETPKGVPSSKNNRQLVTCWPFCDSCMRTIPNSYRHGKYRLGSVYRQGRKTLFHAYGPWSLGGGGGFIRVVSHQGGVLSGWSPITHQSGASSGWSPIRVVSYQGGLPSLIRVVSLQGGVSSGGPLIRLVSHQGGFSSEWSLRVVSHQGGLW